MQVIGRLEGDKREQEEMIAVGKQQVDTHKRVIEMLVEKNQGMQQQMVAMEKRALTAEGCDKAGEPKALQQEMVAMEKRALTAEGACDMVAMEKRAVMAEGMARAFLEISGAEKGYTTFGSAVGLETSYLPSTADLDALSPTPPMF
ncbi:unnamed protein product [Closterium sp. Naga37s-1]|nr:unnamed protein product [Closterium sp. Naga37s-1]